MWELYGSDRCDDLGSKATSLGTGRSKGGERALFDLALPIIIQSKPSVSVLVLPCGFLDGGMKP